MTVLLQDGFHFTLVQRPAKRPLFVFYLRTKVLREFVDNVVSLRGWEAAPDRFQILIENFHGSSLPSEDPICNQAKVENLQENADRGETCLSHRIQDVRPAGDEQAGRKKDEQSPRDVNGGVFRAILGLARQKSVAVSNIAIVIN
jgi:hypothetical protein